MDEFGKHLHAEHDALAQQVATQSVRVGAASAYRALREKMAALCQRHRNVSVKLSPKQRREFAILVQFLLAQPKLPVAIVSLGESPDFVLTIKKKRIGLELTEAFVPDAKPVAGSQRRGSIRLEQERLQTRVVQEAQKLHALAGGISMRVHVSFGATDFRSNQVRELAKSLADLVPKQCLAEEIYSLRNQVGWEKLQPFPVWLDDIRFGLRPAPVCDIPQWSANHGGWVQSAAGAFAAQIAEKEKKLSKYREVPCHEYWLLIMVRGDSAASFLELVDPHHLFKSGFDQVFGFWPSERQSNRWCD